MKKLDIDNRAASHVQHKITHTHTHLHARAVAGANGMGNVASSATGAVAGAVSGEVRMLNCIRLNLHWHHCSTLGQLTRVHHALHTCMLEE